MSDSESGSQGSQERLAGRRRPREAAFASSEEGSDAESTGRGADGRHVRRRQDDGERPARRRRDDSESEGEDLFDERMMEDYADMGALDQYDAADLDDREYAPIDMDARRRAEAALAERDRRERRGGAGVRAALDSDEEEEDEGAGLGYRERQRRRTALEAEADGVDRAAAPEDDTPPFNLEAFEVPLREWIAQEQTQKEVKRRFRQFLETYTAKDGSNVHASLIDAMCAANGGSLTVSYLHLSHHSPILAIWLADVPKQMLELFDEVAHAVVLSRFPDYDTICDEVRVRITQLPVIDSIRDLRQAHLNALVRVCGVVTRRTGIFPKLKLVRYNCHKCGSTLGPFQHNDTVELRITCHECQSSGPFTINAETTLYRNYQKMTLQESPGTVPPGRVPRSKEVILLGDLIDAARPGEEVDLIGVYTHSFDAGLNVRQGFPVFATVLEANYVERKSDAMESYNVTEGDRAAFRALSEDPNVVKRIVKSIAPSIYGHENVKLALAMAMFGGREKDVNGKHRIRGDINVLMLGDPGVAKSQFLKYIEKTAPRCVYTTGKGASAVGLTAAVHKDPMTGEWTLEGGALVLADRGVCCIDEFDKMNDQDRTSIHEAMEQQSISISKASIVTTLQARASVIAAANPIGGRYDVSKTFSENVQLTDPILTRFDILCVLRDEVDAALDERLAAFVVDSHARSHPAARRAARDAQARGASTIEVEAAVDEAVGPRLSAVLSRASEGGVAQAGPGAAGAAGGAAAVTSSTSSLSSSLGSGSGPSDVIPQELLKKYILQAKSIKPQLTGIDQDKVAKLYADLRREAEVSGGVPIAVRHIESMMRMAEATARMRLSSYVTDADLNLSIKVMLESFIQAQKFSVMRSLRRQFARYLFPATDHSTLLLVKLRELVAERRALQFVRSHDYGVGDDGDDAGIEVRRADLLDRARRLGIPDGNVKEFLRGDALRAAGYTFMEDRNVIVKMAV